MFQIVAIVVGEQHDTLVADSHPDCIDIVGGQDGVLRDICHRERNGKFLFVGLVECQRQPEGARQGEEEQENEKLLVSSAEQKVTEELPNPLKLLHFCMGTLAVSLKT